MINWEELVVRYCVTVRLYSLPRFFVDRLLRWNDWQISHPFLDCNIISSHSFKTFSLCLLGYIRTQGEKRIVLFVPFTIQENQIICYSNGSRYKHRSSRSMSLCLLLHIWRRNNLKEKKRKINYLYFFLSLFLQCINIGFTNRMKTSHERPRRKTESYQIPQPLFDTEEGPKNDDDDTTFTGVLIFLSSTLVANKRIYIAYPACIHKFSFDTCDTFTLLHPNSPLVIFEIPVTAKHFSFKETTEKENRKKKLLSKVDRSWIEPQINSEGKRRWNETDFHYNFFLLLFLQILNAVYNMVRWEQCAVEGGRGTFPPLAREGIKIEMSKSRVLVTWIAVRFVLYAAMENKCAERDLR